MTILLDGESLTIPQVCEIAFSRATVAIAPASIARMRASRAVVDRIVAGDAPVYAVNTGVGLLSDVRIPREDLDQLQRNVVRSHAAGVGEPLAREVVRGMMLVRANVLAKGLSGIRPVVAERLCDLLNRGVTPVVPSQGSVGASGDLAPLSHMALVLIGEGEAEFEGAILPGGEALRRAGLAPLELAREGGHESDQRHAGHAGRGLPGARVRRGFWRNPRMRFARLRSTLSAARRAPSTSASTPRVLIPARPKAPRGCGDLLEGSEIRQSHAGCGRVQDAYSLRCAPQVHGAVRDAIAEARRVFSIELNSATDNPLVFGEEILSGGNFHGEPLAFQLDFLAIALAALAGISERRMDRLVNPALNEHLPAFLAGHAGLESGLMMAQVTAAALVAENSVLATPASPGSITTCGNKEDFVSMGMTSAMKLQKVVRNTRSVLAIEALAAARALDLLAPLKTSPPLEAYRARIRSVSPPLEGDRALYRDIEAIGRLLAGGAMAR